MKTTKLFILIFSSIFLLTSCGKETLTPFVSPMTISQLTDNRALEFSYRTEDSKLDEFGEAIGKFPIFGKIFQSIGQIIVNTTIKTKRGHQLALEPIDIDIASYGELDLTYIEWIKFDQLQIELTKIKKNETLEFIDRIEIAAQLDESEKGKYKLNKDGNVILVSYDKKRDQLDCEKKCLKLKIEEINWKTLLSKNKHVKLMPKILINSVPKSTMSLTADIKFSLKLNLGF